MSVIVKSMEMPQNCLGCPLTWVDDDYNSVCPFTNVIALNIGRQDDCPLIELPPHGRLGDLDELKTAFPRCDNSMDIKIASVRATINHAPTVIEAEGRE